jgi:predicted protein tyrosine phosphatase
VELRHLPTGVCVINWSAIAHIDSSSEWEIWRDKLAQPDGLPVYESEGILEEALKVTQSDLEKERLRYQDLQREFEAFKVESRAVMTDLGDSMSNMAKELQRLRGLESELNAIAGGLALGLE